MERSMLPTNSSYQTDNFERRAMSVMSSTSYQYTGESFVDNDDPCTTPPENAMHLSKQDLANSLESYEHLLQTAEAYREQMIKLSSAAAGFGYALERVAHCKTASESGQGLQAAAGLQFLISNHQQILSDMFDKVFEVPLRENLEHHRKIVEQSQDNYESALKLMSKKIRDTEAKNMKNGRRGQRDIRQFRKALQELTRQVNELDRIKSDYNRHMIDTERRNHNFILGKVATVVRGQIDIYERVSNKGLADKVLEQMMHQNPDPFCAYSPCSDESTEIFTVLPPVSLIDSHKTQTGDPKQGFSDSLNGELSPRALTPVTAHVTGNGSPDMPDMYTNNPCLEPEMIDKSPEERLNKSFSTSCLYDLPSKAQALSVGEHTQENTPTTRHDNEQDHHSTPSTPSPTSLVQDDSGGQTVLSDASVGG